jgi:hypothetical protein
MLRVHEASARRHPHARPALSAVQILQVLYGVGGMTNILLAVIAFLLAITIAMMQKQNKKLNATLDAFAEMVGDLMRELITKTEGKNKK